MLKPELLRVLFLNTGTTTIIEIHYIFRGFHSLVLQTHADV